MIRPGWRSLLAVAAATVVAGTACHDAEAPRPDALSFPSLPLPGALAVSAITTGSSLDPDGYTVTVDGDQSSKIATTGVVTFTGLAAGDHRVALSDVAGNCAVGGDNPRTVTVVAGVLGTTAFTVGCTAPPAPGDLTVSTTTTGSDLDPDGYTVTVDGSQSQAIATNGSVTFSGLAAGDHRVALSGVAGNCSVSGDNPRTVTVPAGGTGSTTFSVSCSATSGSLAVTTSTTGSNVDPDGYTVTVDGSRSQAIATNGSVTFSGLSAGDHTVALSGVAGNCSVSGPNPQTVSVPAGATASMTFSVSCGGTTGGLAVTTSTTGSNLDPDGYTVTVDGSQSQAIATNGSVTFSGLSAGDHTVALSGVAGNCSVSGPNPQTVSVPAGGTASTTFSVSCSTTPPAVEASGQGQIGNGSPSPGHDVQGFDFDVRSDLTGRFLFTDYGEVRPDGSAGTFHVDPSDPGTRFTAFRASSSACADPSRGAEFDGIGRVDTGETGDFTVAICDNGPAGSGMDFFSLVIPAGSYTKSGTVTAGDVVRSGP